MIFLHSGFGIVLHMKVMTLQDVCINKIGRDTRKTLDTEACHSLLTYLCNSFTLDVM